MHEGHKFRIEFQTHAQDPKHPEMDKIWSLMGSADTLEHGEELLADLVNQYINTMKDWKRTPCRIFRLTNESRVLAEVNTITGETKAVLQKIR